MRIGRVRMIALRAYFLLTFIGMAPSSLHYLATFEGAWDPYHGVVFSFWSALALLCAVGVFRPLQMIPLLLLKLLYKMLWLGFVGLPVYLLEGLTGAASELAIANGAGVILSLLIIPWEYVLSREYWATHNHVIAKP